MSVGAICFTSCSPPPVAVAVVGWFLCFFSMRNLRPKKKLRDLHQKKKQFTLISTIKLHSVPSQGSFKESFKEFQ